VRGKADSGGLDFEGDCVLRSQCWSHLYIHELKDLHSAENQQLVGEGPANDPATEQIQSPRRHRCKNDAETVKR